MINFRRSLVPVLAGLVLVPTLSSQDAASWPQYRGAARDNIARGSGVQADAEPSILWKEQVGMGYSSMAIGDGRLFTIGHDKEGQTDSVVCLDAMTGKEQWRHTFPAKTMANAHRGGSLTTPTIDGDNLWVSSREGKMFCFKAATGKVVWEKDVTDEFGAKIPTWGFAASPTIIGDRIYMNVGRIVAFDKKGKVVWKSKKDYGASYATPEAFDHKGKACLAIFAGKGLTVLDRKSGEELATTAWKTSYNVNAATPIVIDGERIFVSSGYNRGCGMYRFDGESLKEEWASKAMRNHMSGCVLFDGHLFGYDEGTFKCLDLDGEEVWTKRGFGKCAFTIADGMLVMMGRRGDLVLAQATAEEYRELARVKALEDGGVLWTSPVACGGVVYCRSSTGELACVDFRGKGLPR